MHYYITKDNPDGTREKVRDINGTIADSREMYQAIVQEQVHEYRTANPPIEWRIIRLFDENGEQLAQEH